MSYTVEKLEKSQVKFRFDVDAATFAKAIDKAYDKTKHKFAIAGFRKGHVPKKVIEGVYGKEVFYEDALDIVIPEVYGDALDKETDIEVVAQPELTDFKFNDDASVSFVLTVTVKPEVKLGAYKGLGIEKKVAKISAKQVEDALLEDQQKQARLVDVDTAAENGNTVTIDFVGSVDGEKFDGGSAENYDLELGSNTFIPGFEEQLVGVKAGDTKDVKVKFPNDYQAENLAGKDAVFACTVKGVKIKELPALDDEFAKDISEFDTLAEYKADVKSRLEKQEADKAEREFENAIVDKIVAASEVEIPAAMIDNEAEEMVHEFEYRLMYQGLKLDDYLKYLNMTREKLVDEYKEQGQKNVKVRLVMEAIVKAEEIKFEEKEIDEKLAQMAKNVGQELDAFKKSVNREQIDYAVNSILSDKLMDMLKAENEKKKSAAKKAEQKEDGADAPKAEKKPAAKKTAKKTAEKPSDAE